MVGHTHEDVDQMFSRISVHLTGKPIPTLPVLQSLMRDAYHPTPMVQHLDGLWNYRKLGMASGVTLHGHSGPHVFRFKEVEGAVQLGYKQWPYQSAPYKVIDVTQLAAAFEVDPEPVMTLNEKGRTSLEAMESDLRKWREGGKLTGSDIAWWETHIDGERCMAAPSAPLASSFLHFAESENRDEVAYPELDALSAHINTLSNESNVSLLHCIYFIYKFDIFCHIYAYYKQLSNETHFIYILGESFKEEEMRDILFWPAVHKRQ